MTKKRSKIPRTSVKKKAAPVSFDLTKILRNYLMIVFMKEWFKEKDNANQAIYFQGYLMAYEDWFGILKITKEVIDSILKNMSKMQVKEKAVVECKKLVAGLAKAQKDKPVIELVSDLSAVRGMKKSLLPVIDKFKL